jgi:hypothetical protein
MNDMVVREGVVIPLLIRNEAAAVFYTLRGIDITPWDSTSGTSPPGRARRKDQFAPPWQP